MDSIFFFCCHLFSAVQMFLLSMPGFYDWTHMSQLLIEHEKSPTHKKAYQLWMELRNRLRLGKKPSILRIKELSRQRLGMKHTCTNLEKRIKNEIIDILASRIRNSLFIMFHKLNIIQ